MYKPAIHYILMAITIIAAFSFCITRDIEIEKGYPVDIRNRVIGARLQMDGRPPYFYKWKPQDGLRYYDPVQNDTTFSNNITASPFFHHLLYPVADLPQRKISRIWLAVEYAMLISCMMIALLLTKTIIQRWACLATFTAFLFTEGWISLIMEGQLYILVPFCCFVIFTCIQQKKTSCIFLAGLFTAIMIFTRPTTFLIFLPSVVLLKKKAIGLFMIFLIPVFIIGGYSILNSKERGFWIEYYHAINAHIKSNQAPRSAMTGVYKPVEYRNWEGWDTDSIRKATAPATHFETSNVPAIVRNIFHIIVPAKIFEIIFAITVGLLLTIFYKTHSSTQVIDIRILAIFGFCLYMITDFLSPIPRAEYYKVQWLFPLLLVSSYYNYKLKVAYTIILLGLLLNIFFIPFIPMRHTVGEFMIFLAFLRICFVDRSKIFT